jgi:hypothetical protein
MLMAAAGKKEPVFWWKSYGKSKNVLGRISRSASV